MRQDTRYILGSLAALAIICSAVISGIQSTIPHDLIGLATGIIGVLVGDRIGTYAERARHGNGGQLPPQPPPPTT